MDFTVPIVHKGDVGKSLAWYSCELNLQCDLHAEEHVGKGDLETILLKIDRNGGGPQAGDQEA